MEILCYTGSKDSIVLKSLQPSFPKDCKLTEVQVNDKSIPKNLQFSAWPILFVNEQPTIYGLRAVLTYVFAGSKLLPQKQLAKVETLFSLADSLYTAVSPIIAYNQSCVVKDEILADAKKTSAEVITTISKFFTGENTIGDVYANVIIAIASSLGVDVSPLKVEKYEIPDTIVDEVKKYCFVNLGVPERYRMSPKPTKEVYLSTPIYYVNGVPHIGHVFTTTLVECMAKWYKLRGIPCIYSTGTDEHGLKVQTTAQAHNISPQEWCDQTSRVFFEAFEQFDLHPDVFIRTTEERHCKVATKLWNLLLEKGYLYEGKYEGWYSKREECFIPENQIREETIDGVVKHFNSEDGAELEWSS